MTPYLRSRTRLAISVVALSLLVAPAAFAEKAIKKVEITKIEKKAEKEQAKKEKKEQTKKEKKSVSAGTPAAAPAVPELDASHWVSATVLLGGGFLLLAARRRRTQTQG
jgi:hypothetical protein